MIDELRALRSIKESFGNRSGTVPVGIGDDCAAVSFNPGQLILITTDSQVEGVHFSRNLLPPRTLGRKSVAVSVSDIAAMGGKPLYILATAGFTTDLDENYLDMLIQGFKDAELELEVKLIGGNLTAATNIFIDITVLGEVSKSEIIKRDGASTGDIIFVTGTLGDSSLGLKFLTEDSRTDSRCDYLINRHIRPVPRLSAGRMLGARGLATSMIDVSDGLLLDLSRISLEHGLGAEVFLENIPLSVEYRDNASKFYEDIYEPALCGGEDYELLFTSPPENQEKIRMLSEEAGVLITQLGKITNSSEMVLLDNKGAKKEIAKKGYVHFTQ